MSLFEIFEKITLNARDPDRIHALIGESLKNDADKDFFYENTSLKGECVEFSFIDRKKANAQAPLLEIQVYSEERQQAILTDILPYGQESETADNAVKVGDWGGEDLCVIPEFISVDPSEVSKVVQKHITDFCEGLHELAKSELELVNAKIKIAYNGASKTFSLSDKKTMGKLGEFLATRNSHNTICAHHILSNITPISIGADEPLRSIFTPGMSIIRVPRSSNLN